MDLRGYSFILAGIFFLIITFFMWIRLKSYIKKGVVCKGKITDTKTGSRRVNNRTVKTYSFIVSYDVDGTNYLREIPCTTEEFDNSIGTEIEIRYLKNKPKNVISNNIDGEKKSVKILFAITIICLAIGAAFFLGK